MDVFKPMGELEVLAQKFDIFPLVEDLPTLDGIETKLPNTVMISMRLIGEMEYDMGLAKLALVPYTWVDVNGDMMPEKLLLQKFVAGGKYDNVPDYAFIDGENQFYASCVEAGFYPMAVIKNSEPLALSFEDATTQIMDAYEDLFVQQRMPHLFDLKSKFQADSKKLFDPTTDNGLYAINNNLAFMVAYGAPKDLCDKVPPIDSSSRGQFNVDRLK